MAFTSEQLRNAEIIIGVGRSLGASARDVQIALMTALVESGLRNVPYGDRDSLGLFQQRSAWGTAAQRLSPQESARMFFEGGHGGQRGLFDFHNRNSMSMGAAAQAVQVSAYPDRYAERTGEAAAIMKQVGATPVAHADTTSVTKTLSEVPGIDSLVTSMRPTEPQAPSTLEVNGIGEITADDVGLGEQTFGGSSGSDTGFSPLDPLTFDNSVQHAMQPEVDPLAELKLGQHVTTTNKVTGLPDVGNLGVGGEHWRSAVVKAARKMLGTPYVWGGQSYSGVDCSGLIYLIYNHRGFHLPRISADQARAGKQIPFSQLRPGDLVAVNNSTRNNGADHIGIYAGHGMVIQAPRPGGVVELTPISDGFSGGWGVSLTR